jgi:hypothetical protein
MKISLRLAEHLGDIKRHGLLAEIEKECEIERHTVAALINNKAKYVSLDALGRVADYLVKKHNVDRNSLPAALFGRDPEHFWETLINSTDLQFCVGKRASEEWKNSEYVISSDALLLNRMLTEITHRLYRVHNGASTDKDKTQGTVHPLYPTFHLLEAPLRTITAGEPGENWENARAAAEKLYKAFHEQGTNALIALGSIKSNLVVELMFAHAFGAPPFENQDGVARPTDRRCPIMFRYRDDDPQPPACCGGLSLASKTKAPLFGIYYETENGKWQGLRWEPGSQDVGYLFYAYRPNIAQVEVACGGFSVQATTWLTQKFDHIVAELGDPQITTASIHLGLYLIQFTLRPNGEKATPNPDERDVDYRLIRLDKEVLRRRLKH